MTNVVETAAGFVTGFVDGGIPPRVHLGQLRTNIDAGASLAYATLLARGEDRGALQVLRDEGLVVIVHTPAPRGWDVPTPLTTTMTYSAPRDIQGQILGDPAAQSPSGWHFAVARTPQLTAAAAPRSVSHDKYLERRRLADVIRTAAEEGAIDHRAKIAAIGFLRALPAGVASPKMGPDGDGAVILFWNDSMPPVLVIIDGVKLHAITRPGTPEARYVDDIRYSPGEEIPVAIRSILPA